MIITTTDTVDCYRIAKYFPPIAASIVSGTTLFDDLYAGFTDAFGGRSTRYQQALTTLYKEATSELEQKARACGANAAVGARFEFSQISGKEMQMFMINAVATPVVIKTEEDLAVDLAEAAKEKAAKKAESARRVASWTDQIKSEGPLRSLLEREDILEAARNVRTMYGKQVCAEFLVDKAKELGLGKLDLVGEDIPDTF